jgi:PAS domain S-box-containing protein
MLKTQPTKTESQLLIENDELRSRLAETEATLEAIRNGEVDAIVVSGNAGEKIFTLASAETPYRIIIEEMEEGAITVSEEGIILFCNRKFAQMAGCNTEQIIGTNLNDFFDEFDQPKLNEIMEAGLFGSIKEELTSINKSGERVYLHLSMFIVPEGMLGNLCIIASDITELKKHQNNLQLLVDEKTADLFKANMELKETNATKDKLFSIIAHDLRGPFTSMLGFSELLIENMHAYDSDKLEKLLHHINSAAKSAYTLLENLLIWARSQNKQLLFKPKKTPIFGIVQEVISSLHSLAIIKNITLKNSCSEDIMATADVNMLTAIIRNLISNAVKFSNPGGVVEITAEMNNDSVKISVIDNGVGMKEEIKNRLFISGTEMSHTGTAHEKGTGLGLLICSEFVDKHGGRIWVESSPGTGSNFSFTLPDRN